MTNETLVAEIQSQALTEAELLAKDFLRYGETYIQVIRHPDGHQTIKRLDPGSVVVWTCIWACPDGHRALRVNATGATVVLCQEIIDGDPYNVCCKHNPYFLDSHRRRHRT